MLVTGYYGQRVFPEDHYNSELVCAVPVAGGKAKDVIDITNQILPAISIHWANLWQVWDNDPHKLPEKISQYDLFFSFFLFDT
jgi:hypothetical protein